MSKALISMVLLAGLTAGTALAETPPICKFKRQIAAGHRDSSGAYALFSGPQGTGRNLAADLLAKEFGLELYRVDPSAIVSKDIGETEKNLARLFDRAESEALLLVFDEADALFGRRSGVTDAHDRYGNMEADDLFRQIESHRVPVILVTEWKIVPDPARGEPPMVVWFGSKGPPPSMQLKFCR